MTILTKQGTRVMTSFSLPIALFDRLKAETHARGCSAAAVVREALQEYLDRRPDVPNNTELRRKLEERLTQLAKEIQELK